MVEKSHTAAGRDTGWWPGVAAPLRNIGQKLADFFAPSAEAAQTEQCYEIDLELPGVKPEDIEVSLQDGTLTVKGEKRFQREETGRSYFFSEREYGAFMRSFRLPADVDAVEVKADFRDGVLCIQVPKRGPAPKSARRIEVKHG
jgi:HSP20 family protein